MCPQITAAVFCGRILLPTQVISFIMKRFGIRTRVYPWVYRISLLAVYGVLLFADRMPICRSELTAG